MVIIDADESTILKTPDEWDRELHPNSMIHDPDGWRGIKGRPWTDPITREEFELRRVCCTIGPRIERGAA